MNLEELFKRALEEERKLVNSEGTERKGMDPDEALELIEALEKIAKIDLGKVAEQKYNQLTPIDKMVEDLKNNKRVTRALRTTRKETRKRLHWTQKRNRRKRYDRERYIEVLRPRRRKELAEKLTSPEGWWERLNETWKLNDVKVEMTYEEFRDVLYPAFYPRVPVIFRQDKRVGIRLDNLLVRDTDTREVLFDGKEYLLTQMGYCLPSSPA